VVIFDANVIFSENIADQPKETTSEIHCYIFKTVKR